MALYLTSRIRVLQKPARYVYTYSQWNAIKLPQLNATISRSCHSNAKAEHKASRWMTYRGYLAIVAPVGLCYFAVMQWRQYRKNIYGVQSVSEWQLRCYCAIPWRFISRCWGWFAEKQIPVPFRPWIYGLYSSTFGVNISEAKITDLKQYTTLSDFFARELHDNARKVDLTSCLVSPCDGTVLHNGRTEQSGLIEQVKGVSYSLKTFLGDSGYKQISNQQPDRRLYQCVIYLAPGDYHRFHSPADWAPTERRHFSGQLLSVNPSVANWIPGLFTINERAVYIGQWIYGFFSFTAVGATNVGKIKVYCDRKLQTNSKDLSSYDCSIDKINLCKGESFGEFRMGSTVVLIFEAPSNFEFSVTSGQKVKMGQSIGFIKTKKYTDHIAEKSDNIALRAR